MLSPLPFYHAFSLWQTHTHSPLTLSLSLLFTLTSFDLPYLSLIPPHATLPPFLLACLISHHPCPYPFKPPIFLILKSLSFSMLLSFSLSSHMPPPLLTWQTSPHPLLSSSSPPLILSFPINLSLLFLSHFSFFHSPTPPFFCLTLSYNSPCFFSLLHTSPLTLLSDLTVSLLSSPPL